MDKRDLEYIFDQLKGKYDLILTNAFSLDDGFSEDFLVLTGTSNIGRFWLYDDGCIPVFSVENTEQTAGTHWHPYDVTIAIEDIAEFMEGKMNYELVPFVKVKRE